MGVEYRGRTMWFWDYFTWPICKKNSYIFLWFSIFWTACYKFIRNVMMNYIKFVPFGTLDSITDTEPMESLFSHVVSSMYRISFSLEICFETWRVSKIKQSGWAASQSFVTTTVYRRLNSSLFPPRHSPSFYQQLKFRISMHEALLKTLIVIPFFMLSHFHTWLCIHFESYWLICSKTNANLFAVVWCWNELQPRNMVIQ